VKVTLPDVTGLLNAGTAAASSGRWAVSSGQSTRNASPVLVIPTQPIAGSAGVPPALSAQREPLWSTATRRRVHLQKNHAQDARATWKRLDYDVEGEWGFYLILDEFLKSPVESRRASAGWGGDRFAVYESSKGEVLMTSLSTWDTENDAREFFDAYVKRTGLRYPTATRIDSTTNRQNPNAETLQSWKTLEGRVLVGLMGPRVLIIEGLPDGLDFRSLLETIK
jgi:hypothetical protein